jgi:hypothetical protein
LTSKDEVATTTTINTEERLSTKEVQTLFRRYLMQEIVGGNELDD